MPSSRQSKRSPRGAYDHLRLLVPAYVAFLAFIVVAMANSDGAAQADSQARIQARSAQVAEQHPSMAATTLASAAESTTESTTVSAIEPLAAPYTH